jgi:hypothetical protein
MRVVFHLELSDPLTWLARFPARPR